MITDNLIAGVKSGQGHEESQSTNPRSRQLMPEKFKLATQEELELATKSADEAGQIFRKTSGQERAQLLKRIAFEIEALGDVLINRVHEETGLSKTRIIGERGRTCNQLRLFAELLEEGSWVEAIIDRLDSNTTIRKMQHPIGPVAIFTASNFPLAFSTAGGDTAAALAAACPVIVKAHPSHLGTNALVAEAITKAIQEVKMPAGIFSSLQGGKELGQKLVRHPRIQAVAFTGSLEGGKAIMQLANERAQPIPVFAEMGSINPLFVLPERLKTDKKMLAEQIAQSVNLGTGQFCTKPGLIIIQKEASFEPFLKSLSDAFAAQQASCMLHEKGFLNYEQKKSQVLSIDGVLSLVEQKKQSDNWVATPCLAMVDADDFLLHPYLQTEVFGPFTLIVHYRNEDQLLQLAQSLEGQLSASIFATEEELLKCKQLIDLMTQKVGRLIFNGVPTGVAVCPAMHHGGPFPASSNSAFTSVGTDSIKRFVRPVSYQNSPNSLLPDELKDGNPLNIWRIVNGKKGKI